MIVLGISGYKRSGKDTFARMIKNNATEPSKIISLADPLKEACMTDYGLTVDDCYNQEFKELPLFDKPCMVTDSYVAHAFKNIFAECRDSDHKKSLTYRVSDDGTVWNHETGKQLFWTPRALMIFKGSNQRTVNPNYWFEKTVEFIRYNDDTKIFMIPDVRYINEIESFKKEFGDSFIDIRIDGRAKPESNDASERDLDNYQFSYKISNQGSLEDLESIAQQFIREFASAPSN